MKQKLIPIIDLLMVPIVFISAKFYAKVRKLGISKFKYTKKILMKAGVFPIINHYYEPLFDTSVLKKSLRDDRYLPGIDMNEDEQLTLLGKFQYEKELLEIPLEKQGDLEYYYDNGSFASGDSEALYSMIRYFKPKRIIEIGSGSSTLMSIKAVKKNMEEEPGYKCEIICIEPYEASWLESTGVEVLREKVEDIGNDFFRDSLEENDILFVDSSHIIRPQGDVLFEYLEILPNLRKGVIVHIHDIFTPKDYLDEWVNDTMWLWNEQYLLEAFLSHNKKFKVLMALNYLTHNHRDLTTAKFPILGKQSYREPGSFWISAI